MKEQATKNWTRKNFRCLYSTNTNVNRSSVNCDKKFVCGICQEPFMHRSSFSRHKKSHVEAASHVCVGCNRSYSRKDTLAKHIAKGVCKPLVREAEWKCEVWKAFFYKSSLSRHHKSQKATLASPLVVAIEGTGNKELDKEKF